MTSTQSSPDDSTTAADHDDQPERTSSFRPLLIALAAAAVVVALLLATIGGGDGDTGDTGSAGVTDGEPASGVSAFPFTQVDGSTATLADFQGEPLVVNFFASWCAPCRAELPDFEAVHVANGDAVRFVGVNHDIDESSWRSFVDETEITFDTVFQPGSEIWTELDAKAMPSTAFVSADGEVVHLFSGLLNDEKLQELIDEHLLAEGA